MSPPKVFISHASEDTSSFVVDFARRLRENGVDAWLDQWEMKPGDSLVDKIFEEGLRDARAVIIVLWKSSVQKPWVREELNASVVNRIIRRTRLIRVVIDDCEVPESLRSMVWQRVDEGHAQRTPRQQSPQHRLARRGAAGLRTTDQWHGLRPGQQPTVGGV